MQLAVFFVEIGYWRAALVNYTPKLMFFDSSVFRKHLPLPSYANCQLICTLNMAVGRFWWLLPKTHSVIVILNHDAAVVSWLASREQPWRKLLFVEQQMRTLWDDQISIERYLSSSEKFRLRADYIRFYDLDRPWNRSLHPKLSYYCLKCAQFQNWTFSSFFHHCLASSTKEQTLLPMFVLI